MVILLLLGVVVSSGGGLVEKDLVPAWVFVDCDGAVGSCREQVCSRGAPFGYFLVLFEFCGRETGEVLVWFQAFFGDFVNFEGFVVACFYLVWRGVDSAGNEFFLEAQPCSEVGVKVEGERVVTDVSFPCLDASQSVLSC